MRHTPFPSVFIVMLALTFCGRARADLVYLIDGTVVEGEVTYVGNTVKIRRTSGITVTHPKHMVRRVVKSVSAAGEYRKRSGSVEPDDARGLVELARWCRQKKLDTEAEAAYRAALELASPVYREAKREFAKFLEGEKRLKEAHKLYTELGGPAANDAAVVSAQLDRLRAEAYEQGTRRLRSGKRPPEALGGALLEFVRALKYTPSGGAAVTGVVTEADVLAKIVEVRKDLVDSTRPPVIEMEPCGACRATGLVACKACNGKGQIRKLANVLTKSGIDLQWRWFACEVCKAGGKVRCDSCGGASIDVSGLGPARSAVRSLANAAVSGARGSFSGAVKRMNDAIKRRRLAFGPGEAPYLESRRLRKLLPGVPATAEEFRALEAVWRGVDGWHRLNFLANYALEATQLLSYFSESAHKEPGVEELHGGAESADATELSAFPADAAGLVLSVPCVWQGGGEEAGDKYRLGLAVETDGPHSLAPFVWKPEARPVMERLGGVLGLPGIATRAASYPFVEVADAIRARRPGDRVALVGRMLYDKVPSPEWRFEVWSIVPRLDEDTERLVALLSRKVSFRFDDTPLDAAIEMLSDLTGVRMRVELPPGAGFRVTARARKVPLSRALDAILQKLDLAWRPGTIDVKSVRVVDRVTPEERARVEELLNLIRQAEE